MSDAQPGAGGDDMVGAIISDLVELEERVDERFDEIQDRLDDLERRTDMLQLVEDVDEMAAKQRSITILQHMHRKLLASDDLDAIHLTKDDVETALHFPDIDRTTYYTDMRRCQRLVGNDDICWYKKASEGDLDEAAVYLDLSEGDIRGVLNGGV